MLRYTLHRLALALVTLCLLWLSTALLASWLRDGAINLHAVQWLTASARFDFGATSDGQAITTAIGAALPASALLLVPVVLLNALLGWGGGTAASGRRGAAPGRWLIAVLTVCQTMPVFWLGGVLTALGSVRLGWLPPGGISGAQWPAFGTTAYGEALRAAPLPVLADLLRHMLLPVLTLLVAEVALDARLAVAAVSSTRRAPWSRTARGAGLSEQRLLFRALRAAAPSLFTGSAANAPMLICALILVEYLFAWPGLGMLAYHAARQGDGATLSALLLLSGTAVLAVNCAADLLAAWADPRLRAAAS